MRFLPRICRAIDRHCSAASVILGKGVAWLTAVMAVATTVIVISRALFDVGAVALQESVTYMHALVMMCAAAYTLRADGHVRVDIFYRSYSPLQKAWLDALGTLLFLLPFCIYCGVISWNYVANSWAIREASPDAGGIPAIFLMKSLIIVYGATLALQGLAELARNLITLLYVNDHE
ncbi:hypothetical protein DWB84_10725 [Saccharophagus sp. K07]|uniref:TRAP transporter small permease subunit n=1 Tax=Saccharophagus sp. K07 TaxID=2283636 RepID=UPI001651B3B5|nr:TRAP transporter small permease subunit [Saccharophagus sp. K07]MBC6905931.1 hypothetical protein [Saccharophagus sp. K07]